MLSHLIGTILLLNVVSGQVKEPDINPVSKIIDYLSWCESRHNELAWNKDDTGSPSIGRFQFKLASWKWVTKRYDLKNLDIMSGKDQEILVRKLIEDNRASTTWKVCWNLMKNNVLIK